ncbi:MAG: hypothetical protein V3S76_03475, partial [Candidatus Bipolaricaulota bacterium]
ALCGKMSMLLAVRCLCSLSNIRTCRATHSFTLSAREQVWKDVNRVRTLSTTGNRKPVYPETYSEKTARLRETGGGGGI